MAFLAGISYFPPSKASKQVIVLISYLGRSSSGIFIDPYGKFMKARKRNENCVRTERIWFIFVYGCVDKGISEFDVLFGYTSFFLREILSLQALITSTFFCVNIYF